VSESGSDRSDGRAADAVATAEQEIDRQLERMQRERVRKGQSRSV
jgi:hypothetical protein